MSGIRLQGVAKTNSLQQGAAQGEKGELNGKAQPFLTTGGEAVSKRQILQRKQEVARSLKQRVNSEILHTTVFGVRARCLSPCRTVMFFASSPLIDG